ncbi:hypothetical protein KDH_11530 [Dictyobacter sp. S3.2.2.5]|uniref:Uncharacterized protein n=1 Tax=Dictyobacter halimunensis TaxID=3026934 RepID=A0ABQ6FJC6_9CHLR|nr:hypothetical protein KDH_11530 [Dictyobacter sp. S3.2.2.5]
MYILAARIAAIRRIKRKVVEDGIAKGFNRTVEGEFSGFVCIAGPPCHTQQHQTDFLLESTIDEIYAPRLKALKAFLEVET